MQERFPHDPIPQEVIDAAEAQRRRSITWTHWDLFTGRSVPTDDLAAKWRRLGYLLGIVIAAFALAGFV